MYKYFFIILFFCSCFSEKKAERDINKIQIFYPELLAKKTSEFYPCINQTIKIDSTKDSVYKQIEIQIKNTTDTIQKIINEIDTIKDVSKINYYKKKLIEANGFIEGLQQTLQRQVPYIERTIKVTDTALQKQLDGLIKDYNDYRLRYERLMKILLWVTIALSVSIIINIIKVK